MVVCSTLERDAFQGAPFLFYLVVVFLALQTKEWGLRFFFFCLNYHHITRKELSYLQFEKFI